jgi:hypothetical protein
MITNATMTIRCTVLLTGNVLTITNERAVSIDLTAARKAGMTEEEAGLIDWLTDGLPPGRSDTADLSIPAMRVLASLWQRFPATASQPAPTPASNPPARPRPVPVAPAGPTAARTSQRVVEGHAGRTMFKANGAHDADYAEARVDQLRRAATTVPTSYHLFFYDIKDSQEATCPNPSWRVSIPTGQLDSRGRETRWMWPGMWRMGFRLNLSCWVVDSSLLPGGENENPALARLCQHWDANGVNYHTLRFHECEMDRIQAMARAALDEELRTLHTSLITRLATAGEELARVQAELATRSAAGEEVTEGEMEAAERAHDNAVRSMLRTAQDRLATCLEFAERYDDTMVESDLFAAYRAAIDTHRTAFNARMTQLRRPARLHID